MNSSDNSRFRYIPHNRKEIKESTGILLGFHLRFVKEGESVTGFGLGVVRVLDRGPESVWVKFWG